MYSRTYPISFSHYPDWRTAKADVRAACFDEMQRSRMLTTPEQLNSTRHWFLTHKVLVLGASEFNQKANLLKDMGIPEACFGAGPGFCAPKGNSEVVKLCSSTTFPMPLTNRTDWDLVLWSMQPMHWMHLPPVRPELGALHCPPLGIKGRLCTVQDLWNTMQQCAALINATLPLSEHLYALANSVCSAKYTGTYAKASADWKKRVDHPDYSLQFTEVGSATVHVVEREVARQSGHRLQDSFTQDHCPCTLPADGRHYPPLDLHFLHSVSQRSRSIHHG